MSDSEPGRASGPDPGDHYRANGTGPVPTGTYRVVGRDGEAVTLLHVGDDEGRRRHTGRVESVDRSALPAMEETDAPGGARTEAANAIEGLWLSARMVPGNLRDRPGQVALGVALLAVGAAGPALLGLPPLAAEGATLLGALLVAAAASGLPR